MKKRIISLVLVAAMLLCVLPAASAAEKPDIAKYYLSLNDSISISFKVTGLNAENFGEDGYYATFKKGDAAEGAPIYKATKIDGEDYVFTFDDLTPRQLATEVLFTVYDSNGEVVDSSKKSVLSYCLQVLNSQNASGNLKTLVVDLLNYGAAAQTWFKDTTPLANADLTAEQKLLGNQSKPKLTKDTVDNTNGAIAEAGLALENAVQIYFIAGEGKGVETLDVTVGTKTYEGITAAANGRFYFDKLNAAQMREKITVQAKDANGAAVGGTLTYSIVSYAYDSVGDIENLTNAMMRYGDTASGYVEKPNADNINALFYDDFSTLNTDNWTFDSKAVINEEEGQLEVTLAPNQSGYYTLNNVSMPTDQKYSIEYRMKIVGDTANSEFQAGIMGKPTTGSTVINVAAYKGYMMANYASYTKSTVDGDFHTYTIDVNPLTKKVTVKLDGNLVVADKYYCSTSYECNYLQLMIKDNKATDDTKLTAVYDYLSVKLIPEVQSDVLLDEASVGDSVTKTFDATSGRISFEWDYTLDPGEADPTKVDAKLMLKGPNTTALNISAKYNAEADVPGYYFCTYDTGAGDTTTHYTDVPCVPGTPYRVKVVVDLDTNRYDMYVEGVKAIDFSTLRTDFTDSTISKIETQNSTEGVTATFENVTVKKTNERVGVIYSNDFSDKDGGVAYKGAPATFDKQYCSIVVECRMRHYEGIDTKLLIQADGKPTIANFSLKDNYCKNNGGKIAGSEGKVNVGQWNDVKIVLTFIEENQKGTYTASVNGVEVVTDTATGNVIPYIDKVTFTTDVAGDYYVDDLIVYKAP